jgi:hypothetical protein
MAKDSKTNREAADQPAARSACPLAPAELAARWNRKPGKLPGAAERAGLPPIDPSLPGNAALLRSLVPVAAPAFAALAREARGRPSRTAPDG